MSFNVKIYDNGDHTCIVWRPAGGQPIKDCRGFAISRKLNGTTGYLRNSVGFKPGDAAPAPGNEWQWPIQRFLWWDYTVKPGDKVQYSVVPVVGSHADGSMQPRKELASPMTPEITVSGQCTKHMSAYFNRGIIASQWVIRALEAQAKQASDTATKATLKEVIGEKGNQLRDELGGLLKTAVLSLLKEALDQKGSVYAALYELNDPELLDAMTALGASCNLVLGNGAFKSGEKDENAVIRTKLKSQTKIKVFDRIVSSPHFAHNKFLVLCGPDGKARKVLTGSTNWTMSGLCTQANNGLIIDDPAVAGAYRQQWDLLRQAGNAFPASLVKANSAPSKTFSVDNTNLTVWFTPTGEHQDLDQARKLISQAKRGILFLFFNPGHFEQDPAQWTLLQAIMERHQPDNKQRYDPNLYIHGVVNQEIPELTEPAAAEPAKPPAHPSRKRLDPSTSTHPVLLYTGGKEDPQRLTQDVMVPKAIKEKLSWWVPELLGVSMVNIHSKVVVLDPFGDHPVVMTGSHNLGLKASAKNDDNLVIIENAGPLAAAYAVNIIAIFQEYRWRAYTQQHAADPKEWRGLEDNDQWQDALKTDQAELDFWLGTSAGGAKAGAGE